MDKPLDAMGLYHAWGKLDSGDSVQLRRVSTPDELRDIPTFYRLVQPFGWNDPQNHYPLLRMVFCLSAGKNVVKHTDEKISLGKALAKSNKINERRIFQLIRTESPGDMVQLRRLLIHAEPVLNWPLLAKQLIWWGKQDRRQLLEDFVLSTSQKKTV